MDLGTGLAIGIPAFGAALSAGAVIITAIKVKANKEPDGVCPLHSGIDAVLDSIKERVDGIEQNVKEGFKELRQILMKG